MAPWVTEKFLAVLQGLEERYKLSKGSDRKEVIEEAVKDITASAEKDTVAIPPGLEKKVLVWFQNSHQKAKQSNTSNKANHDGRAATTWTVRKVVKEALSAELNALILTKDPTAHPGTKDYLKLVQDCLTELIKGLSKKQLEDFADVANVRNTVGVEPGLKAKQADKHFIGIAKKFTEDVYKQMGVKVFMLVGYQNTEGDLVRAKVETDTFAPTSKQFSPIFKKVGDDVWNEWEKYLQGPVDDAEEDDGSSRRVVADKSVPWPLHHDENGYPTLPDMVGKSLPDLKDIIRSFVTLSYRHAAHNPKAVVPWKALAETPDKFLELCYLPAGIQLTDISKIKAKTLNACLVHWSERVRNGDIAFRFKAVEESHLRVPKSQKKRPAPASEDQAEQSSKADHPSTSAQQKSKKAHPSPASEDEEEASSEEDQPSTRLGATRSVEGGDSDNENEDTGKGKRKHLPPLCPADVPNQVQEQFAYLFSLSKEKEYVQLLKLAANLPEESEAMVSGTPSPKWVSWSYKKKHLSGRFHSSSDAFEEFITWLKKMPYCTRSMKAYPQSHVLVVCLGIGMLLRDLHVVQFDLQDPASAHLRKSKLEWAHNQVVVQMCLAVVGDLEGCLDAGPSEHPVTPQKGKKLSSKRQKIAPDSNASVRRSSRNK